jgi:hypothetical protein
MHGVRTSAHPGGVLTAKFQTVDPDSLAAELTEALGILDEVGADQWDYALIHGVAAALAAVFGNVTLARREATVALEIGRRLGNPTVLGIALYAVALAWWQSDPTAARAALEENINIARASDYEPVTARVLALLAQLQARNDGDAPAALAALREAIGIAHMNDDRPAMATSLARGADVMAALGEYETAAVFVASVTNGVLARRTGVSPNEIPDHNQLVTSLQSELGDDRYAAATARGVAVTYEQISAFALAAVEDLRQN